MSDQDVNHNTAGKPASRAVPALGAVEMLRWLWTQITSMRTALILLFALAAAAIPGSLVPQRPNSPIQVNDFRKAHPVLDKLYQPLGMYDVYASPWFSAIYLLLFVSLIGCIVPRIGVYARALRNPPPPLPSRLNRLPEWGRASTGVPATQALDAAERWLRSKHYRVRRVEGEQTGLSAERGHLREFGNLLFHLSLVAALVGVAWNSLWGFKGTAIVVEGQGFSNVITQYDEFRAGAMVDTDDLEPFTVKLNRFIATFERGKVQRGAARDFRAEVVTTVGGVQQNQQIRVNHPLDIQGMKVHILGHGYAANVTVKDASGKVAFSGPVVFQPQDGNFSSMGVIKAPDARPKRLAFQGFFLPTAVVDDKGPHSVFPDAINPEMFLNAWTGPPKTETGRPENVYTLDTTGMTQVTDANGEKVAFRIAPGETYKLPNGQGEVTFTSWSRWSKLQISRAPGLPLVFVSLALGVLGLCLSLFVRPRRLWLKVKSTDDSGTLALEVGGLDRADSRSGLADDVVALLDSARGEEA